MDTTTFVVARKGTHDELRKKFCDLREKVYHCQKGWEEEDVERNAWKHEPHDYILILDNGVVVGGCIIISGLPLPVSKIAPHADISHGSVEISRMINIGLRDLIPFYGEVLQYCLDHGVETAYATIRRKFWRKLRFMHFSCLEAIEGAIMTKGSEEFIPVRINTAAVADFFGQWQPAS